MTFKFHENFYSNLETEDFKETSGEGGKGRIYHFNGSSYESVTTFLSRTETQEKKDILENWKNRIGDKEAHRQTEVAKRKGTDFHHACEEYLLNEIDSDNKHFKTIKKYIDNNLTEIHKVEGFLYSDKLKLAGRTDCIGIYKDHLSVIDFKNSKSIKPKEWITSYFIQEACYSLMYRERYNLFPTKGVILMSDGYFSEEYIVDIVDYVPNIIERKKKHG